MGKQTWVVVGIDEFGIWREKRMKLHIFISTETAEIR
jgi:hypothetical protein